MKKDASATPGLRAMTFRGPFAATARWPSKSATATTTSSTRTRRSDWEAVAACKLNRAMCHLKVKNYADCEKDCSDVIDIDPTSMLCSGRASASSRAPSGTRPRSRSESARARRRQHGPSKRVDRLCENQPERPMASNSITQAQKEKEKKLYAGKKLFRWEGPACGSPPPEAARARPRRQSVRRVRASRRCARPPAAVQALSSRATHWPPPSSLLSSSASGSPSSSWMRHAHLDVAARRRREGGDVSRTVKYRVAQHDRQAVMLGLHTQQIPALPAAPRRYRRHTPPRRRRPRPRLLRASRSSPTRPRPTSSLELPRKTERRINNRNGGPGHGHGVVSARAEPSDRSIARDGAHARDPRESNV